MKPAYWCLLFASVHGYALQSKRPFNRESELAQLGKMNIDYDQFEDDHGTVMQADLKHNPSSQRWKKYDSKMKADNDDSVYVPHLMTNDDPNYLRAHWQEPHFANGLA